MLGDTKPILEERFHYSFTHFTITFASQRDMENADQLGLIDRFTAEIQNLYGHTGTLDNPFDAEMAVYATYEGKVDTTVKISPS